MIADTFALSVGTHNEKPVPVTVSNPTDLKDTGEYLQAKDCQKIQNIAGIPIDHSFLKYKKELTEYGYQVGKISIKEQTVIFNKMG